MCFDFPFALHQFGAAIRDFPVEEDGDLTRPDGDYSTGIKPEQLPSRPSRLGGETSDCQPRATGKKTSSRRTFVDNIAILSAAIPYVPDRYGLPSIDLGSGQPSAKRTFIENAAILSDAIPTKPMAELKATDLQPNCGTKRQGERNLCQATAKSTGNQCMLLARRGSSLCHVHGVAIP